MPLKRRERLHEVDLMMSKFTGANVHVCVRIRPQSRKEEGLGGVVVVRAEETEVVVSDDRQGHGRSRFTFDQVFPHYSRQVEIFQQVGIPLIRNVFEGYNATVFAYGQTNAGKTHTMFGPDIADPELAGIIPRIVAVVFETIAASSEDLEFTVRASFCEIYLEKFRDLLDLSRTNLKLREDPANGIYVENLSSTYVNSFEEMMNLMEMGTKNRATAATGMNEGSSRSHSVFMVKLVQKNVKIGTKKTSTINLVDLAGSESLRKSGAGGERLDEAKNINLSLLALGNVINSLTDERNLYIPYRDSKLTHMLQESLGGNARTWLVINVSSSSYNLAEIVNTLRFGYRAKSIKNKARINRVRTIEELERLLSKAESTIRTQRKIIESLKEPNSRKSSGGIAETTGVVEYVNGGGHSSADVDASGLADRLESLETQVKEAEEERNKYLAEQNFAADEARILTESLNSARLELQGLSELREKEAAESAERIKALSIELNSSREHIQEMSTQLSRVEHEKKELHLSISTLNDENDQLRNELDSLPITVPNELVAEVAGKDLDSRERATLENTDASTEQRLNQLVILHRQLLRNIASFELSMAEKERLLILKEERIVHLEEGLKEKDANLRQQADRFAARLDSILYSHSNTKQDLERQLRKSHETVRALQEVAFNSPSLYTSSMKKNDNKIDYNGVIRAAGNRIKKPLRGGNHSTCRAGSLSLTEYGDFFRSRSASHDELAGRESPKKSTDQQNDAKQQ